MDSMNISPADAEARFAAVLELASHGVRLVPGSHISADGSCSCGYLGCRTPGVHPMLGTWRQSASADQAVLAQWWARWPTANLIVPLTGNFEVLDLPRQIASAVLLNVRARVEGTLPAIDTPIGRRQLWVRAGTVNKVLGALSGEVRPGRRPDLRVFQQGFYVVAPPSQAGPKQVYAWHRPLEAHIITLASSASVVEAVIKAYVKAARSWPVGEDAVWRGREPGR